MKGEPHFTMSCLLRRTPAPCAYFLAYGKLAASNGSICFSGWPLPETAVGVNGVTPSWVPLTIYDPVPDTIVPRGG